MAAPCPSRFAIALSAEQCPPDISDVADMYWLNVLPPPQAQILEEHCVGCPPCSEALEMAHEFLLAMRAAGEWA